MPREALSFRRPRKPPRSWRLFAGMWVVVGGVLAAGSWSASPGGQGSLVEVTGAVPNPGTYLVDPPTVEAALAAAGVLDAADPRPVPADHRVDSGPDGVRILPPTDPVLVGLPVDVNQAGHRALTAVPGIGSSTADAILADRESRGPFYALSDLDRVSGVGPHTVERIAPFLTVGPIGPRPEPTPVDVNRADAGTLEGLPGIGPVTAARIVVDREERGPYATLEQLQRVKGIGPKTVERLREHARVEAP